MFFLIFSFMSDKQIPEIHWRKSRDLYELIPKLAFLSSRNEFEFIKLKTLILTQSLCAFTMLPVKSAINQWYL